jgi:hypothetical protein
VWPIGPKQFPEAGATSRQQLMSVESLINGMQQQNGQRKSFVEREQNMT